MTLEEKLVASADAFAALIAASPYLREIEAAAPYTNPAPVVPVLTERAGDLNTLILDALNKLGLSVTIVMPDADKLESGRNDALLLRVRLVAEICELAFLNREAAKAGDYIYRPALAVTTAAMRAVQGKPNGLDPLVERNGVPVREHRAGHNEFTLGEIPFRSVPDKKLLRYHVTATTTITL